MKARFILVPALIMLLSAVGPAAAQQYSEFNRKLVDEHIYGGMPGYDNVLIRQAYVLSYNYEHRIPNWVAYHVKHGYTNTVPRYGIFSNFRVDPQIHNPVRASEYRLLNQEGEGYAMKPLVPFGISGGDRDGDELMAVKDTNGDGRITAEDMKGLELWEFVADADEINRVYEINYLSNVVPQDYDGFDGGRGIWSRLERYVQETLVEERSRELWVMAGPVFGNGPMKKVGVNKDITVPPMFFKILVRNDEQGKPLVLAYLVPHHKEAHGDIEDYLVSVDMIEAMTGLDFFRELDDEREKELESADTWLNRGKF